MTDVFDSTDNFDEVDEKQEQHTPTPQEEFEQNFNTGLAEARNEIVEDEPAQEVKHLLDGWTNDELIAVLEKAKRFDELESGLTKSSKATDKAFGHIGQLRQELDALKQTRSPTQISKEMFKNVSEYFADEDFAEKLAADLAGLQLGGQEPAFDAGEFETNILSKVRAEITKEYEKKLISIQHPDWQTVTIDRWETAKDANGNDLIGVDGNEVKIAVHTEDFKNWLNTLPSEGRQRALNSVDAVEISHALTKFKEWRGKKAESEIRKQQRLQDAIPVKSSGNGRTDVIEDAFAAGIRKVHQSRGSVKN